MILLLLLLLPDDSNFLFHLATQPNLTLFKHIVNHQTSKILVKNASNEFFCISCHHKLGNLIDIVSINCFLTNIQSALDTVISPSLSY